MDGQYKEWYTYKKCGKAPVDEFFDVEWILSKEGMAVRVNGELRHFGSDYGIIKAFKENPEHRLSAPVSLSSECGSTVTVESLRVTEIPLTAEETAAIKKRKAHLKSLVDAVEAAPPHGEPVDIDLTSMVKSRGGDFDLKYTNGLMAVKSVKDLCTVESARQFSGPLKIELCAKTDKTNLQISYAKGLIGFNPMRDLNELRMNDIANGRDCGLKGRGNIPVDEFVDIEWIIGEKIMVVKDGNILRHIGDGYPYISDAQYSRAFREMAPVPVRIAPANGSTVTVESLCVTEI